VRLLVARPRAPRFDDPSKRLVDGAGIREHLRYIGIEHYHGATAREPVCVFPTYPTTEIVVGT